MDKAQISSEIIQNILYPRKFPISVFLEEISPGEFMLIASFLAYEKECGNNITVNELASRMEVTVPAVSRTLRKLEERGLINRVTGEECKRNTFVVISDKGRRLFDENKETVEYMVSKLISALTPEEIENSIAFHKKITALIDKECKEYLETKVSKIRSSQ